MPRQTGDGGPMIKLQEVAKVYGSGAGTVFALDRINLDFHQGEFVVILGPSGSGKSTLLNLVGGVDTCNSGSILVKGQEISALTKSQLTAYRRKLIGFIFQQFNLLPSLTARENVDLVANLTGRRKRTGALIKEMGLENLEDRFPGQLSGGEQQRVAIARALVKEPGILLCDEPTGSLDYENGRGVLELLRLINNRRGTTTLLATHNSVIAGMADRIIRLGSGKVLENALNSSPCDPRELRW
ncbi:MAG TPA: ABC transporter ATP-binding protein [Verrucomicrobiae bacterium]|nr:ABC transporter ATP-binding protein [Verrucomicrobiae bacterium]